MDYRYVTSELLSRWKTKTSMGDITGHLNKRQKEMAWEYIQALDHYDKQKEEQKANIFNENGETIARGRRYAAATGVIAGGILGYLTGRDVLSTSIGAVTGTAILETIEHLFRPLAHKFGLPQEPKDSEEHEKIARRYQHLLEDAI